MNDCGFIYVDNAISQAWWQYMNLASLSVGAVVFALAIVLVYAGMTYFDGER